MVSIRHELLNSIKNNIQLGQNLDWIEERKAQLLQELSFDVVFNHDDVKRMIDKILICYSDIYFDDGIREENKKLLDKLMKLNKLDEK